MAVTDEEVLASRKRVDDLRQAVQAEKDKASAMAMDGVNEYQKSVLDTEATSLEAELAALREANDPATLAKLKQVGAGPQQSPDVAPEPGEQGIPEVPSRPTTPTAGGLSDADKDKE